MQKILPSYRGNKDIPGLFQFIINRIPKHFILLEPFAGSAAISNILNSPVPTFLNDCDQAVTDQLNCNNSPWIKVLNFDALFFLSLFIPGTTDIFAYCDPPYLKSTRSSSRDLYNFEMTLLQHRQFLSLIRTAKFNCMISHYKCDLYDSILYDWNQESTTVRYHNKTTQETIYYNYPSPDILQSYSYVGDNSWDRQRIKRKISRWTSKLNSLPTLEKNSIINKR